MQNYCIYCGKLTLRHLLAHAIEDGVQSGESLRRYGNKFTRTEKQFIRGEMGNRI